MLVLTLHRGDRIRIGDDCWLALAEQAESNQIKLAFSAPRDVVIVRERLLKKIDANPGRRSDLGDRATAAAES